MALLTCPHCLAPIPETQQGESCGNCGLPLAAADSQPRLTAADRRKQRKWLLIVLGVSAAVLVGGFALFGYLTRPLTVAEMGERLKDQDTVRFAGTLFGGGRMEEDKGANRYVVHLVYSPQPPEFRLKATDTKVTDTVVVKGKLLNVTHHTFPGRSPSEVYGIQCQVSDIREATWVEKLFLPSTDR